MAEEEDVRKLLHKQVRQVEHAIGQTLEQAVERVTLTDIVDFCAVALVLALAAVWAVDHFFTTPPYVSEEKYPVRGIDISAHNGMINFGAAAADGISFAFLKASEGDTYRDTNFELYYSHAAEAGIKLGAYHYFRFDVDGVPQALNFLNAVKGKDLDLGLAIDVEEHGNATGVARDSIAERLTTMVEYLNLRGYRVILYSNRDGYYDYIEPDFKGLPLWICSFSNPPVAAEWTFWQYDHRGRVKGISGDVDLNAYCGSRQEWVDFLLERDTSAGQSPD